MAAGFWGTTKNGLWHLDEIWQKGERCHWYHWHKNIVNSRNKLAFNLLHFWISASFADIFGRVMWYEHQLFHLALPLPVYQYYVVLCTFTVGKVQKQNLKRHHQMNPEDSWSRRGAWKRTIHEEIKRVTHKIVKWKRTENSRPEQAKLPVRSLT